MTKITKVRITFPYGLMSSCGVSLGSISSNSSMKVDKYVSESSYKSSTKLNQQYRYVQSQKIV